MKSDQTRLQIFSSHDESVEQQNSSIFAFDSKWSTEQIDNVLGWGASLIIHVIIVLTLFYLSWPGRPVLPSGPAEVGLVMEPTGNEDAFNSASEGFEAIRINPVDVAESLPEVDLQMDDMTLEMTQAIPQETTEQDEMNPADMPGEDFSPLAMGDPEGLMVGGGRAVGGTASFFGLQVKGQKFVYVVDYSGSMTGLKLQRAKQEIVRSLYSLDSNMEFFIIFYDNGYMTMPGDKLMPATDMNKQRYANWLLEVRGGGGTDPTGAMMKALSLGPDAVWLLSDGRFDPVVCDVIQRANAVRKVRINTIAYHDDSSEQQLRLIAQQSQGQFRFVPAPAGWRGRR